MTNKFAAAVVAASLVASFAFAADMAAAPAAGTCSDAAITDKAACEAAKGTWTEAAAPAAK